MIGLMARLSKQRKQKVTEDWAGCFPDFEVWKPLWLMRRFGPILQGILLNRSRFDDYRPTAHVHPLFIRWDGEPSLMFTGQFDEPPLSPDQISFSQHEDRFAESATRLIELYPLPLSSPLSKQDVLAVARRFVARRIEQGMPAILEAEFLILLSSVLRETESLSESLSMVEAGLRRWPDDNAEFLTERYGVSTLSDWFALLADTSGSPEDLDQVVETQARTLGVEELAVVNLAG